MNTHCNIYTFTYSLAIHTSRVDHAAVLPLHIWPLLLRILHAHLIRIDMQPHEFCALICNHWFRLRLRRGSLAGTDQALVSNAVWGFYLRFCLLYLLPYLQLTAGPVAAVSAGSAVRAFSRVRTCGRKAYAVNTCLDLNRSRSGCPMVHTSHIQSKYYTSWTYENDIPTGNNL